MSEKRGCFKTGCMGCLGIMVVGFVISGTLVMVGWSSSRHRDMQDRRMAAAPAAEAMADTTIVPAGFAWQGHPGKEVLKMSHGGFTVTPAAEGVGLSARARFDAEAYTIAEKFSVEPDSTWVYSIEFHRHMNGMQALFRGMFMHDNQPQIEIALPGDVPLALVADVAMGGAEMELGGLWLTSADLHCNKGGFSLAFSEPLREPMDSMVLSGSMGGLEVLRIGNASPRNLDVDWRMGGGDIDLRGAWRNDCRAGFAIRMGGMSVTLPQDIEVDGAASATPTIAAPDRESPLPVLHISKRASMGEIEFQP